LRKHDNSDKRVGQRKIGDTIVQRTTFQLLVTGFVLSSSSSSSLDPVSLELILLHTGRVSSFSLSSLNSPSSTLSSKIHLGISSSLTTLFLTILLQAQLREYKAQLPGHI
jgi:ABC-type iron transport system FetAB permease component